jgi:hypothetical protein
VTDTAHSSARRAQVFARVSPGQKELILKAHRAAGRTTLMCGDGTNDVGALKAAHVGIALMAPPSEAKVAAVRAAGRAKREARVRRDVCTSACVATSLRQCSAAEPRRCEHRVPPLCLSASCTGVVWRLMSESAAFAAGEVTKRGFHLGACENGCQRQLAARQQAHPESRRSGQTCVRFGAQFSVTVARYPSWLHS